MLTLCLFPPQHLWQSLVKHAGFRLWALTMTSMKPSHLATTPSGRRPSDHHAPQGIQLNQVALGHDRYEPKGESHSLHRVVTGEKKKPCHTTLSYLNRETIKTHIRGFST